MLSGSMKTAFNMLKKMDVEVLEFIVVDELCEFKGRQNLANTGVKVTSLVKTTSDDAR